MHPHRNIYYIFQTAILLLYFCYPINGARTKSEIPSDWKSYIASDILEQYLGKDSDDKFTDGLFEGDILGVQSDSLDDPAQFARNAVTDTKFRWPGGVVPFVISEVFRPEESKLITRAMKSMSALTYDSVTFVERTDETDYVHFSRGLGCYSLVGRHGGKQVTSLSRGCLEAMGDIQHEIMHVLGFYHEMSRFDRDDYVWINWENVQEGNKHQFEMHTNGSTFGLPYDYESVLHYPWTAFAIDTKKPTIVPKRKGSRIGQNRNLSPGDIKKLKIAYKDAVPVSSFPREPISVQTIAPTPANRAPERRLVLPLFRMDDVTMSECLSLDSQSQNCHLSTSSNLCTDKHFRLSCQSLASNSEMRLVLEKIEKMNRDRPIWITMEGQRSLTQQLLAPVARNILWLQIYTYENLTSGMLKNLDLPNLIELGINNCINVRINNGDLDSFPQLRILGFYNTWIVEIEKGSFDALPGLKMLVLEYNLLLQSERSTFREQILRFHCSCEYVWLRDLFRRRPLLLKARRWGEIFNVAGLKNTELEKSAIFVPVDCAKDDLIGSAEQESFSINDDC